LYEEVFSRRESRSCEGRELGGGASGGIAERVAVGRRGGAAERGNALRGAVDRALLEIAGSAEDLALVLLVGMAGRRTSSGAKALHEARFGVSGEKETPGM